MSNPATSKSLSESVSVIEGPSQIPWHVLAMLMGFSAMCHFNRVSISVAGTEQIMEQYEISETSMGSVYSAYLFIYTMCMMPGGWLIDRFGPRAALLWMGCGSVVFVCLTSFAGLATTGAAVLFALLVIRGLLGSVNAPMHPGAARAVSLWIPYRARAGANGLITGSALLGISANYYVFGFLMDHFGWPAAFVIAGIATSFLTLLWFFCAPRQAVSSQVSGPVAEPMQASGNIWKSLFRNRSLILLTLSFAAVGYFQYLFFYWIQHYFSKVLDLGKEDGRMFATITTLAMAFGMIVGGWLADRSQAVFGERRGRALVPICGMLSSSLFLIFGLASRDANWVVTFFALSMAAVGMCEASFWVTGIELGGRHGGTSAAFLNTGGNIGGIFAPVVTPYISLLIGWQNSIVVAGVFCIIGGLLWFWIDPKEGSRVSHPPAEPALAD